MSTLALGTTGEGYVFMPFKHRVSCFIALLFFGSHMKHYFPIKSTTNPFSRLNERPSTLLVIIKYSVFVCFLDFTSVNVYVYIKLLSAVNERICFSLKPCVIRL